MSTVTSFGIGEERVLWELGFLGNKLPLGSALGLLVAPLLVQDVAAQCLLAVPSGHQTSQHTGFCAAPGSSFLQGPVSESISSLSLRQLFTFLFV